MEIQKSVLKSLLDDLHAEFPDIVRPVEIDVDATFQHIETVFFPECVKIVKKDTTFFTDVDRVIMDINLSDIWRRNTITQEQRDKLWSHVIICTGVSLLRGDITEKFGTILSLLKGLWTGKDDEVSRILSDDKSEGYLKSLFDYITETRIAKIFGEIVEEFDFKELELDFSNLEDIANILKNPEHPVIKKVISKLQRIGQQKLQSGAITQAQIQSEIEGIKARVQSIFGSAFNDFLGGGPRTGTPSSVLLANSPEARRQRMIARLQKRQMSKK